ncbi:MAG: cytochrome C [Gammaproteobacteria bacterium]|nr:MAG: cytochrome C [Gammaproteobacteria bacterium]
MAGGALLLALPAAPALAVDGQALLQERCASCHNLTGPAPTTLEGVWNRKGPDLFYAGLKYRRDWVVRWLQHPTRIRPAGMYYGKHLRTRPDGQDEVDPSTLVRHPVLSRAEAEAAADALMRLKAKSELIRPGEYKPGRISMSLGDLLFDKFKGCIACHRIEPDYGGLSGPEVYTAWARLQPDWMISYMRNPQAWDPRTFMPRRPLKERDLQNFVHYFKGLYEEMQEEGGPEDE